MCHYNILQDIKRLVYYSIGSHDRGTKPVQYNTSIGQQFHLASTCTATRRVEKFVQLQLNKLGTRISGSVREKVGDVYEAKLVTRNDPFTIGT